MKILLPIAAAFLLSVSTQAQFKNPQYQKAPQQKMNFQSKGAPMPNFVINKSSGGNFSSQSLVKGKPVMIMIFSPDCDHCGHMLDSIKTIKHLFKQTQVVLVAEDRTKSQMLPFIKKHNLNQVGIYKAIGTNKGDLIAALYTFKILPQVMFYDSNHKLIRILDGNSYSLKDLKQYIK